MQQSTREQFLPRLIAFIQSHPACQIAISDGLFSLEFLYTLNLTQLNVIVKPAIISAIQNNIKGPRLEPLFR